MNEPASEGRKASRVESLLMMELRHAHERAELIENLTRDAYVAGLKDRARPENIGATLTLMEQITAKFSEQYAVSVRELRGPGRARCYSDARRSIWCELRERGYSYPQIGKFFGRDHTSIMHGVRAHDKALADMVKQAEEI